jgi:MFS family permease
MMESPSAGDPRDETRAEQDDRNLIELLQELRVAGLGVQVLFGFLLSLPFTSQFQQLDGRDRDLYVACLLLAAVATALLLGPVAYHRLVFRQGQKEKLVQAANVMAILGLITVGLSISASVLLVAGFVAGYGVGSVIAGLVLIMFALLWFAFPLARR